MHYLNYLRKKAGNCCILPPHVIYLDKKTEVFQVTRHESKHKKKSRGLLVMFIIFVAVALVCAAAGVSVLIFTGNTKKLHAPTPPPQAVVTPPPKPSFSAPPQSDTPEFTGVTASSVLPASGKITYDPECAADGYPDTAWSPAPDDKSPWIELSADEKQTVAGFYIVNGYAKSERLFLENRRAKSITVTVDGAEYSFTLEDGEFGERERIELPEPAETSVLKITVNSSYKGTKYDDICITDIEPF